MWNLINKLLINMNINKAYSSSWCDGRACKHQKIERLQHHIQLCQHCERQSKPWASEHSDQRGDFFAARHWFDLSGPSRFCEELQKVLRWPEDHSFNGYRLLVCWDARCFGCVQSRGYRGVCTSCLSLRANRRRSSGRRIIGTNRCHSCNRTPHDAFSFVCKSHNASVIIIW